MGKTGQVAFCLGCSLPFVCASNAQKYCTYRCGDKIRSKSYRDLHENELKSRRDRQYREDSGYRTKINQRHKQWRINNQEWLKEYSRNYNRENRLILNSQQRGRYKKDPSQTITKEAIRRARKTYGTKPECSLTKDDWLTILKVWGWCCAYCGRTSRPLTQDHVVPLSKGGQHTVNNIVPACRSCNSKKFNRDLDEFLLDLV